MRFDAFRLLLPLLMAANAFSANFGKKIVIGGHASDIALDERRGRLYIANLGGNRVDVLSTQDLTLGGEPLRYLPARPVLRCRATIDISQSRMWSHRHPT